RKARLLAQALCAGVAGRYAARAADARRLRAEAPLYVSEERGLVFAALGLAPLPGELGGRRRSRAAHADPGLPRQEPSDLRERGDGNARLDEEPIGGLPEREGVPRYDRLRHA